jgi:hypothetical protein
MTELAKTDQRAVAKNYQSISVPAVVAIVEHEWNLHSRIPSPEFIANLFGSKVEPVQSAMSSPEFTIALERRGITTESVNFLSAEQVAVANVMLDYSDVRTQAQKLKAAGVTTQKWQAWQANPIFSRYLKSRAENLLEQVGVVEAHTALLKQTSKGNVQAIKLMYEVTGRHRDSTSLNVEYFLQRVLEIIQTHVREPGTLNNIADDFKTLLGEVK